MFSIKDISSYNIDINEMLKYSIKYFTEEDINHFDINVIMKELDVYGILFSLNNRYMFYKLSKDGYLPFYMEYFDNKIIVNENEYYTLCKGNNYATIINNDKSSEDILSYKNGFIKYNYHNLNNDKLYTFFYKQGQLFNNNKQIIVADYLNIPDGFCYQNSPKSILSYGYFKTDISTCNPLAVLSETDNILDFFNVYDEYRKKGFPDIEIYTKIKKNKNNYISPSINFSYRNEENYMKSLEELGISYKIPKLLVDFYNGSFNMELILNEIINTYNEYKKDILIKKIS